MNTRSFILHLTRTARGTLGREELASNFSQARASLAAFAKHLRTHHRITRFQDTTLPALRSFPFDPARNDDHHLRRLFAFLHRPDLLAFLAQVSARKYFLRKTLANIFKNLPAFQPHLAPLRDAKIRTPAELLARAATRSQRAQLAKQTHLTPRTLLQLARIAELCQMTGMSGQTLRRSLSLNLTSLSCFRKISPEKLRTTLAAHLQSSCEKTNSMIDFTSFISQAQSLPDTVRP